MHLKMERESLLKAVGKTLGVVDRRGTMPILSHFLLEAKDNQVAVAAAGGSPYSVCARPAHCAGQGTLMIVTALPPD